MPDTEGPERRKPGGREFMREKIVRQPLTGAQRMKRLAAFFCLAILFGIIAAVSFVLAKPLADRYLGERDAESTSILFTMDEPETTAAPVPTAQSESMTAGAEEPDGTGTDIGEAVEKALAEYRLTTADLDSLYGAIREVAGQVDKGIVTVSSGKQQQDLFGNPVESTGDFAGAVIARTRGEFLIFTYGDAVRQADSIAVTFFDGSRAAGQVRQVDEILNMAVVAVRAEEIDAEVRADITVVPLGNSYSVKAGDFVIGSGSPAGFVHSVTYGAISYIARNVQMTDGITRILYADIRSNSGTGTFLLNTGGEIIGWTADEYKTEECKDVAAVVSISDYKAILEKMTNGREAPYFGVKGQEVNEAMAADGMPQGVYVTEAVQGGPAYDEGIQNGDIITRYGEKDITTFKELQMQIESSGAGDSVPVKVMRKGRDGYTQLEYAVTIRDR